MNTIEYLGMDEIEPKEMLLILNEDSSRSHLVSHPYFDEVSMQKWMKEKVVTDSKLGCKVRAVVIDGVLAGWCGIQPDEDGYEIAIVISKRFWGAGLAIFKTIVHWAGELGHEEILFHLLESRREYKSIAKKASKVRKSRLWGRGFTTYYFQVGNASKGASSIKIQKMGAEEISIAKATPHP